MSEEETNKDKYLCPYCQKYQSGYGKVFGTLICPNCGSYLGSDLNINLVVG